MGSRIFSMKIQGQDDQRITALTRRKLLDVIMLGGFHWTGRLNDLEFLQRIYDLDNIESHDSRYSTARGDIRQHRLNNYDWQDDWIWSDPRFRLDTGPDQVLLRFLAEMLHPIVRDDAKDVANLLRVFNNALAPDGYMLYQQETLSGHPIYGWRNIDGFHTSDASHLIASLPLLTDPRVLQEHLNRISDGLQDDPAQTISSCKELIESLCKIILKKSALEYSNDDDVQKLYRKVADLLLLNAEAVTGNSNASKTSQKILRTLVTTVQSLAELRNELGLGHGRESQSTGITRHARLSFNATVTVAEFLLATWQDRIDSGKLTLP